MEGLRYSAPRPAYHLAPPTCFLFPTLISVPPAPCIGHRIRHFVLHTRGLATPLPSLFPHTFPSKNPKSQYECPPLSSAPVLQYLHQISFPVSPLSLFYQKTAFRISPRINSLDVKTRVPQVSAWTPQFVQYSSEKETKKKTISKTTSYQPIMPTASDPSPHPLWKLPEGLPQLPPTPGLHAHKPRLGKKHLLERKGTGSGQSGSPKMGRYGRREWDWWERRRLRRMGGGRDAHGGGGAGGGWGWRC